MRPYIVLPTTLIVLLITLPARGNTPAKAGAKLETKAAEAKAKPSATAPILLPEARPQQPYDAILAVVLNVPYGRAQFSFDALPEWLSFDPVHFIFAGTPTETSSVSYKLTLTVKNSDDQSAAPQVLLLTLPVIVGARIAYQDPAKAPKPAAPIGPTGKPSVFKSGIIGVLTADGKEPVSPGADPGKSAAQDVTPPTTIPVPKVYLDGQPTTGSKISGHVTGLASPATASTTGKPGNLPMIGLLVMDPIKGSYRAPLTVTATQTALSIEVSPTDGTFTLQPVTALSFGQSVSVIADAPPGHIFEDKTRTASNHDESYTIASPDPSIASLPKKLYTSVVNPLVPAPASMQVYSGIPLVRPTLTTQLANNITVLNGTATLSQQSSGDISIAIRILQPDEKGPGDLDNELKAEAHPEACLNIDKLESGKEIFEVLTTSDTTSKTVQTSSTGTFSATLTQPLLEGDRIQLVQVFPAGVRIPKSQQGSCRSAIYRVNALGDWGRVHADFTAGILMSNNNQTAGTDSGNFSQAHQFIALTVEKNWALPGCYLRAFGQKVSRELTGDGPDREDMCYNWKTGETTVANKNEHLIPGFSSYFESRLTAIPVSSLSSKQSGSGSGGSGTTTPTSSARIPALIASDTSTPITSATDSSPASILSNNQIGSAQTARIGVGVYLPFLITRWDYHRQPNALFIAPLGKIGFDTVTGASSITVTPGTPGASITSGSSTISAESLYNYRGYGARIGHFEMTRTEKRSPETNSYLDITYGPYSNLESLVCHRAVGTASITTNPASDGTQTTTTTYTSIAGQTPATNYAGSSCVNDYPAYYNAVAPGHTDANNYIYVPVDSRKRLYRLDLEGLLKIPNTWFYVGFNANIGQKNPGSSHLDHGYAAPDDLRFLFGTKFDISTLLTKAGIKPF